MDRTQLVLRLTDIWRAQHAVASEDDQIGSGDDAGVRAGTPDGGDDDEEDLRERYPDSDSAADDEDEEGGAPPAVTLARGRARLTPEELRRELHRFVQGHPQLYQRVLTYEVRIAAAHRGRASRSRIAAARRGGASRRRG
jgi:hypothetical protein